MSTTTKDPKFTHTSSNMTDLLLTIKPFLAVSSWKFYSDQCRLVSAWEECSLLSTNFYRNWDFKKCWLYL